jgi:hypothetical protein
MATEELASAAQTRPGSRVGKVLTVLGLLLAALGVAYVAGRLHTASKIDQADARAVAALDERDRARKDVAAEQAAIQRLEARRRLHLALIAVEARNFGIAQGHLDAAAALVAQAGTGAPAGFEQLQRDLRATRLVATEDLGVQRQRILDWVRRFDELAPPAAPAK